MTTAPNLDDLLLEWEDQEEANLDNVNSFCESRGIHDASTIEEFARRAIALDRISRFLSQDDRSSSTPVSALIEQTNVQATSQLDIQAAFAYGGRSAIHRAIETPLSRPVAVKTLLDEAPHQNLSRARLIREAKILGSLQHPAILPVYQLYESDNDTFYTMPLVQGETLQQRIAQVHSDQSKSFTQDVAPLLRRFTQVCQAAAFAHEKGICHRDIKPENILLGDFGTTYLVDWGIARSLGRNEDQMNSSASRQKVVDMRNASEQLTSTGSSMGTPAYMSPEQAAGRDDIDEVKSDIFNLGATLYTLLTGQPPYSQRSMPQLLEAAANGSFHPPRKLNTTIPRQLESICLKAMSADPKDRYASAEEIQADIDCWFADLPFATHRETIVEKLSRWNRKNGKWVAATMAMASLIIISVIGAAFSINLQKQRSDQNTRLAWQTVNQTVRSIEDDESLKFANMRPLRKRLLETSLENYDRLLSNPANRSALRFELGDAYLQSGNARAQLEQNEAALEDFHKALNIFETSDHDQRSAERAAECLIAITKATSDPSKTQFTRTQKQVENLWRLFPESVDLRRSRLEILLESAARETDTSKSNQIVTEIKQQLAGSNPDRRTKLEIGVRLNQLRARRASNPAEKTRLLEESLSNYSKLVDSPTASIDSQLAYAIPYAETLRQRSQLSTTPEEQTKWLENERTLVESMAIRFPTILEFRVKQQNVLMMLAQLHRRQGHFEQALQHSEKAFALNAAFAQPNVKATQELADTLLDVANWHRENGRTQESQFALQQVVNTFEEIDHELPDSTKQTIGQNLLIVGVDQWMYGNAQAALESFSQSTSLFEELLESNSDSTQLKNLLATSQMALALSDTMLENHDAAIQNLQVAIEGLKQVDESGTAAPNFWIALHTSHFLYAALLERVGRSDEADHTREQLKKFLPNSAESAIQLARAYAWESQIYGRGKPELSENDLFFIDQYHQQTIELVEVAIANGFNDYSSIQNDPNFQPLFRHAKFRNLIDAE